MFIQTGQGACQGKGWVGAKIIAASGDMLLPRARGLLYELASYRFQVLLKECDGMDQITLTGVAGDESEKRKV